MNAYILTVAVVFATYYTAGVELDAEPEPAAAGVVTEEV